MFSNSLSISLFTLNAHCNKLTGGRGSVIGDHSLSSGDPSFSNGETHSAANTCSICPVTYFALKNIKNIMR